MSRILVWQCDRTSKLFVTKKDYKVHLCDLASRRAASQKKKKQSLAFERQIAELHRARSFKEVEDWLNANAELLVRRRMQINPWRYKRTRQGKPCLPAGWFLGEFQLADMKWSDSCPNSHAAPRGKKTNWGGRDKNGPLGFPGFRGRIRFKSLNLPAFASEPIDGIGLNTGTGGGGDRVSYDLIMFAEDWPFLFLNSVARDWSWSQCWQSQCMEGSISASGKLKITPLLWPEREDA